MVTNAGFWSRLWLLGALLALNSYAQQYPNKPIRFVIPYPPGGPTDITGRIVAQQLGESFRQQIVVDNRSGAGGLIGTDLVAKAAADGYTVLVTAVPHVVNPSLFKSIPYDTIKDFQPVVQVITYANILVVNPAIPAASVKDLISLAKSRPGQLNYGSGGNGTSQHLSAELFRSMAGIDIVHIPYKGGAAAMTDLQAGQVALMFETTLAALPHIKSGRVKALAVTSAERSPLTPELPTVAESGLLGFEISSWVGMLVPSGTPKEVIAKLNAETNRLLKLKEVRARISGLGGLPAGGAPDAFGDRVKSDILKWSKVVRDAGMKVD